MGISKILITVLLVIFFSVSLILAISVWFVNEDAPPADLITFVSPYEEDNNRCLKCHGQDRYEYINKNLGIKVKAKMYAERIIKEAEFYKSNHKTFSCTDCHSEEYVNFPHDGDLRMEQSFNCIDCHGGDESYAHYHFEDIEVEYEQSVHFKLEEEGFSCWKCHNPHSYQVKIRTRENLKEAISYNNAICLNCHSDYSQFQLLSDREEINIIKKHDWLPNQASHFANVRCIECHTKINNDILVAHLIRPKEEAVRLCNECHSKNSILMASLYKFESKQQRRDGFFNGVIMNESYVIGANRNEYLNLLSLLIFFGMLGVVSIHIFFRLRKNDKSIKED